MSQIMRLDLLPTIKLFMYTNKSLCFSTKWWDGDSEHCSTPREVILTIQTCFLFYSLSYNYNFFKGGQCDSVAWQSFRLSHTEPKERRLWVDCHNDWEIHKPKNRLPFFFFTFAHGMTAASYSFDCLYTSVHIHIFTFFFILFWSLFSHLSFFFSKSAFLK